MREKLVQRFYLIAFIILALLFIIGIISCSPQRRLNTLLRQHPELVKRDTVFIKDTIITHHYHVDTILSIHHHYGDTVTIHSHKLTERIIYLKGDSIRVEAEVISDTIIKNVPYYINTAQAKEIVKVGFFAGLWNDIKDFFGWSGLAFWILLVLLVLWKIFKPKLPF